jgi:hypothetical protein
MSRVVPTQTWKLFWKTIYETADKIIINFGKIYNFAAAETVKAGEKSDSSQQGEV